MPGDELPFVKAGRIVQQAGQVTGQDRTFIVVRGMAEFQADVFDTAGECPAFFPGRVERFLWGIREKGIFFESFSPDCAPEQVGVECDCP